jgi:hypothetical protein
MISIVIWSIIDVQRHTLPCRLRTRTARWPMANRGTYPTIKDMKLLCAINLPAADPNRKFDIAAFDA